MYPCIRPGDVLHLEPAGIDQIEVGDIAVYRRNNRLFAHRAIAKEERDGSLCIVTRPDTARFGDDGPSFESDIVGKISHIERNNVFLNPGKKESVFVEYFFLKIGLGRYRLEQYLKSKIVSLVRLVQSFKIYRVFASFLFRRRKIDFRFEIPLNTRPDCMLDRKSVV